MRATLVFIHPPLVEVFVGLEQDLPLLHLHLVSETGLVVLKGDVGLIQDHRGPALPRESHLQLSISTPPGDEVLD